MVVQAKDLNTQDGVGTQARVSSAFLTGTEFWSESLLMLYNSCFFQVNGLYQLLVWLTYGDTISQDPF